MKPGFTKLVPGFLLDRVDSVADDNNCVRVHKEVKNYKFAAWMNKDFIKGILRKFGG